jgi:hypothetical protein
VAAATLTKPPLAPAPYKTQQRFLSVFPDIPEPLDADSGQRCVFLDTGQRLYLANSGTTRVHISDPQHSAAGTAANQETANMANDSPLKDSDADYSDSLLPERQRSPVATGESELSTVPPTPTGSAPTHSAISCTAQTIPVWQCRPLTASPTNATTTRRQV